MAPSTPTPLITVDVKKGPLKQSLPFHNRWHPDIPHVRGAAAAALPLLLSPPKGPSA